MQILQNIKDEQHWFKGESENVSLANSIPTQLNIKHFMRTRPNVCCHLCPRTTWTTRALARTCQRWRMRWRSTTSSTVRWRLWPHTSLTARTRSTSHKHTINHVMDWTLQWTARCACLRGNVKNIFLSYFVVFFLGICQWTPGQIQQAPGNYRIFHMFSHVSMGVSIYTLSLYGWTNWPAALFGCFSSLLPPSLEGLVESILCMRTQHCVNISSERFTISVFTHYYGFS